VTRRMIELNDGRWVPLITDAEQLSHEERLALLRVNDYLGPLTLAVEPEPKRSSSSAFARGMRGSELAARKWSELERQVVDDAIERAARELETFTADDVWKRAVGVPVTKGLAGRLNAARNRGVIEATGEVVFAERGGDHDHRQRLAVWRRVRGREGT